MELLARTAILALMFTIGWQNIIVIPGVGTVARLTGGVAALLGVLAFLGSPRIRQPRPIHVWMLLFVMWAALSLSWASEHDAAVNKVLSLGQVLVALGLTWRFIVEKSHAVGLVSAYVGGAIVGAIATLAELQAGREAYYLRYAASGFDPNDLAVALAAALPMGLYLLGGGGGGGWFNRALGGAFSLVGPTAILVTGSRTGLVSLLAGAVLAMVLGLRLGWGARIALVLFAVMSLLTVNEVVPEESWVRLSTLGTEAMAGRFHGRERVWEAGIKAWDNAPIWGVGLGGFRAAARAEGADGVAHNTFVSILVELGIIGLVLFLGILISALRTVGRMEAKERDLFLAVGAAVFVGINMLSWDTHKALWLLLGVAVAFGAVSGPDKSNGRREATVNQAPKHDGLFVRKKGCLK